MNQSVKSSSCRLGEWTIEPQSHEIVHMNGRRVRLEARTMRVLELLHAHAGAVVSSEDMLREVWGRKIVSPQSIATAIGDLRRALGDDSRNPRYIQTIPKRGYRLVVAPDTSRTTPQNRGRSSLPAAGVRPMAVFASLVVAMMLAISGGKASRDDQSVSVDSSVTAHYVRARELWNRRDHASILEARRMLQQIIDEHDSYAPAYAALADIYAHKTGADLDLPEVETFREAQRLIDRARALKADMPELYVTQALLDFYRDHQPYKALLSIDTALQQDPQFAYAWQTRAMVQSSVGQHEDSLESIERAASLDPASTSIAWDHVWFLYLARDYDRAYTEFVAASDRTRPNYLYGALIEQARGHTAAAFSMWMSRFDQKGVVLPARDDIEATAKRGAWTEAYRQLAQQSRAIENYEEFPAVIATWQLLSDDPTGAGTTLKRRAFEARDWTELWRGEMPIFDPLNRGSGARLAVRSSRAKP